MTLRVPSVGKVALFAGPFRISPNPMKLRSCRLVAALAPLLLLSACAQPSRPSSPSTPPVVRGQILFEGEVPPTRYTTPPPPLDAVFPQGIPYTRYQVSPDRGLAEVVVSVVNPPADRPAPPTSPQFMSISNTICVPRVLAVQTNQTVVFQVRGDRMFNLNATSGRPGGGFNQAVTGNMDFERVFPEAGARYRLMDNVHVWLTATIWAFDHPWFAVTDAKGTFELPPLPPGRYTVQIEHRAAGRITREIEVPGAGESLVWTLPAKTNPAEL